MLVKPTTMMNKSGRAVKDVMLRWGLLPSQIVVVLDDVDLPLGTIRIRPKAVMGVMVAKKCYTSCKNGSFPRIRLGIAEISEDIRPSKNMYSSRSKKEVKSRLISMINRCRGYALHSIVRPKSAWVHLIHNEGEYHLMDN